MSLYYYGVLFCYLRDGPINSPDPSEIIWKIYLLGKFTAACFSNCSGS